MIKLKHLPLAPIMAFAPPLALAANDVMTVSTPQGNAVAVAPSGGAYAICDFTFKGQDYINGDDTGRCLQSAFNFYTSTTLPAANCDANNTINDGLVNCPEDFNPNEAGAETDKSPWTGNSSSVVLSHSAPGSSLYSKVDAAFWRPTDQTPPKSGASGYVIERTVQNFDPATYLGHVWTYDVSIKVPATASWGYMQAEMLTGYMHHAFTKFYKYNPTGGGTPISRVSTLSNGPGEQEYPVFLCTADDTNCMGAIYLNGSSYRPPNPGTAPLGYGRWRYGTGGVEGCSVKVNETLDSVGSFNIVPGVNCTKWNVVARIMSPVPGHTYSARIYLAFGDKASMAAIFDSLYSRSVAGTL